MAAPLRLPRLAALVLAGALSACLGGAGNVEDGTEASAQALPPGATSSSASDVATPCAAPVQRCDGNVQVTCAQGQVLQRTSCTDAHATCQVDAGGNATCVAIGTTPTAGSPCGQLTAFGVCDGDVRRFCDGQAVQQQDCGAQNTFCIADASGLASCGLPPPVASLDAFDIHGQATKLSVYASHLDGAAITYDVGLGGKLYAIRCQASGDGRSCAALAGGAPLLTATFNVGVGMAVRTPQQALGGAFGPVVLRQADVAAVADPAAFVLLDQAVLGALPPPAGSGAMATTYAAALGGDPSTGAGAVWDTMRFRFELQALTGAQRSALEAVIQPHLTDAFVMQHMQVDHARGWLAPGGFDGGRTYAFGGFLNGHRTYLRSMEAYVRATVTDGVLPFRRLPAFDPAGSVPPEFMLGLTNPNIQLPLPLRFQMAGIDASSPPSADSFGVDLSAWHNQVHTKGGGVFAVIMTSPNAPVFFCWHTGLDVIYDGFNLVTALH